MSNHNFSLETQEKIKDFYLHSKSATQIAEVLDIKPMAVHNFIQSKQQEWADEITYCTICGVKSDIHPKCEGCESLIHNSSNNYCSWCSMKK